MIIKSNSIAFKRKQKRKTQAQLAKYLGCSRVKVSLIENNLTIPCLLTAKRIAAFLDADLDNIFEFS